LGGNLYFHDKNNALLVCHAYQQIGDTIDNNKRIADANSYLHWEAMQYFKNKGIIRYDLGMLNCDEIYSNRQMSGGDYFKRKFGGEVVSEYNYVKFDSPMNKLLYLTYNYFRKYL
jgi:lipid II:glycine glycyltransferase (peptidoglycan interpeptide bridge formation enzyme)